MSITMQSHMRDDRLAWAYVPLLTESSVSILIHNQLIYKEILRHTIIFSHPFSLSLSPRTASNGLTYDMVQVQLETETISQSRVCRPRP